MGNLHPSIFFSQREMRNWTAFYALGERELDFLSGGKDGVPIASKVVVPVRLNID